jgi:hypothetical protein
VLIALSLVLGFTGIGIAERLLGPGDALSTREGLRAWREANGWWREPLMFGFVAGVVGTIGVYAMGSSDRLSRYHEPWTPAQAGCLAVVVGLVCSAVAAAGNGGARWDTRGVAAAVALPSFLVGVLVAYWISRSVGAFVTALSYLRTMALPAIGFVFGYLLIIVWFAWCYIALDHLLPGRAFADPETLEAVYPSVASVLYFSALTTLTLGYNSYVPAADWIKVLAVIEGTVGMAWTVVAFSAVVAYLEPIFARLYRQTREGQREAQEQLASEDLLVDRLLARLEAAQVARDAASAAVRKAELADLRVTVAAEVRAAVAEQTRQRPGVSPNGRSWWRYLPPG